MTASISTFAEFSSFEELRDRSPEIFKKINYCCGLTSYSFYKIRDDFYSWDFNCSVNAWRFDTFVTDAQWRTIAQLCIKFKADISEVVRNLTFETDYVTVKDIYTVNKYSYPTSLKGWVGGTFFFIEENGRAHA